MEACFARRVISGPLIYDSGEAFEILTGRVLIAQDRFLSLTEIEKDVRRVDRRRLR
jgi:hypothetical protein